MPAPNKKNIAEWFGSYFVHEGLDPNKAAGEMAKFIKESRSINKSLEYVNKAINAHGIEAIRGGGEWDSYYGDSVALYVNTGDTYNPTILYDTVRGKLELTTMGDFVERYSDKYGIT